MLSAQLLFPQAIFLAVSQLSVFFPISPFSAKPPFLTCFVWVWGFWVFSPLISSVQGAIQHPSHFIPPFRPKSTEFFVHPSPPRFTPQALFSLICTKLLCSPTVFCPTFCLSAPAKNAPKLRALVPIPSPPQRPCLEGFLPSHQRTRDRPCWEDGWTAPTAGSGTPTAMAGEVH